jgi:hypothetical protein
MHKEGSNQMVVKDLSRRALRGRIEALLLGLPRAMAISTLLTHLADEFKVDGIIVRSCRVTAARRMEICLVVLGDEGVMKFTIDDNRP